MKIEKHKHFKSFFLGFKIMLTNLIFIFKGRILYLNMDSVDFFFGKRY